MLNRLQIIGLIGILFFASCEEDSDVSISFDNNPISYSDIGAGKPALVFVHGWCTDKSIWENQTEYFKGKYQVVTLDLAGHGLSGKNRKNWTPVNFARDVIAVINDLELEEVILIGHSISEDVIVRAARMEPNKIKALVGIENFKDVGLEYNDSLQGEADRFFALMERNFYLTAEVYANDYLFSQYTNADVKNRIMKSVKESDPKVALPVLKLLFTDYQEDILFLKQMVTPLYLINSTYSPTDTAALRIGCNLGYQIKYMDRVGHYPMIEDAEKFNELLEETLQDIAEVSEKEEEN